MSVSQIEKWPYFLNEIGQFDDRNVRLFRPGVTVKFAIFILSFLIMPAMSLAYNGDPNMVPGYSDQGAGRVDVGTHAQTSSSVDMIQSMMDTLKGITGNGLGSPNTSGVVSQKQAAESITRKNSRGYRIKAGDQDADADGDGVVQ